MRRAGLLAFVLALVLAGVAFAYRAAPAHPTDHLTGIVLMNASATTVVVHHDAFAGMPAMTMDFTIPAGTAVRPGDHIAAGVDRSTEPWSLSDVKVVGSQTPSRAGDVAFLAVGDAVPQTPFIDERGRRMTLAALHGHPYVLTFIYTRCRDPRMCPLVSAKMRQLQTRTAGTPADLVEVSLDPAYDRPPVLARYAAQYGADLTRWTLLTGDPRTVLDFAARFRILEHSAGPDTIVHSERLAVVDAAGRIRAFSDDATWRPADIAAALARATGSAT